MPFAYRVDPERRIVTITYHEPITFEGWREAMQRVFHDPDYRPGFHFLGDRRGSTKAPTVSYVERVVEFLAFHASKFEGAKWANVVPAGERGIYGMGRMVDLMTGNLGGPNVRTFEDYDEAVAWLAEGEETA